MKKTLIKQGLLAAVSMFAFTAIAPAAVYAQTERTQDVQTQAQQRREIAQQNGQQYQEPSNLNSDETVEQRISERREQGQTRLEAAKLKACQNREKAIQNIMARVSDRGNKQLEVFTKISDRVQAFYEVRGLTLSNYAELVAEVSAKKEAAQTAVDIVKSGSTEFSCDGESPKAVVETFKENLKSMNTALKEYRTAVKNLIVGFKSVQSTIETDTEGSQE
jgi:hypothetical protein